MRRGTDPLPRCYHGNAMLDGSGERLKPPCGCYPEGLTLHDLVADSMTVADVTARFEEVAPDERGKVFWSCLLAAWNAALERAAQIADLADRKPGAEDVPIDIRDAILLAKRPSAANAALPPAARRVTFAGGSMTFEHGECVFNDVHGRTWNLRATGDPDLPMIIE